MELSVAIITGSSGLVGSEAALYFEALGLNVVGIDNGMREVFFGRSASTQWMTAKLKHELQRYTHYDVDIRDTAAIDRIFAAYAADTKLVIHAAAQPSHDWAATDPVTDFTVNANGTSVLLEATRRHAPEAVFIYMSTNKVYGDRPNSLPLIEHETRWEIDPSHAYANGIPETMPVDATLHSLFGASKLAADVLVQEYGHYFDMKTVCFRGGCLTGPNHSGTQLHGFLAYLMKCAMTGAPYTTFGYKEKQVRDNIHSADLIRAFHRFFLNPRRGAVYNIGGGRFSNCSMLEAIALCEEITGNTLNHTYVEQSRRGDHIWWISDLARFKADYPDWSPHFGIKEILQQIYELNLERWGAKCLI
jgi:CDP-paratose 2-epimerase